LEKLRVAVVGAGVIGLAVACRLQEEGAEVTVIDRDPEGDKASFGNAGGIAVTEVAPASVPGLARRVPGWLLDPLGPLAIRPAHAVRLVPWLWRFSKAGAPKEVARIAAALAALNSRVYDDLLPMLERTGLSGELNRKGALTVYESESGFRRDGEEWALKRSHGVVAEAMEGDEARAMEPALGAHIRRAVFTPQWSHVNDPKRLADGLRLWLQAQGATIMTGAVRTIAAPSGGKATLALENGQEVHADKIVVAAGVWSGAIARGLGDRVLIESERGYNATLRDPGVSLQREIIFAEKKFVVTPLSCGLRIGGAAEFGGLGASANYRRSDALVTLASRYLPGLNTAERVNWAGHRPATPDSLPVIGAASRRADVFYAFGHGHLGLTQAATTGRLIADLIYGRAPAIDVSPYSIARFR
jgi:glycine/D-amino acid oxidase-like deaminating enzyme